MNKIIFHQFDSQEEAIEAAQASGKILIKVVFQGNTYSIKVYEKCAFLRFFERTVEAYGEFLTCEALIIVNAPITGPLLDEKVSSLTPLYFSKLLHD